MLEPEPPVHDRLRFLSLHESSTLYSISLLPLHSTSRSLTPLLNPAKIYRHPILNSGNDPCAALHPPHPRLHYHHLTYHHPSLLPPSLHRCCLPHYTTSPFPTSPLHPSLNASVGNVPIAAPASSFTPRSLTPPNQSVMDGRKRNLEYCDWYYVFL